jgi:uncharacterized repeat protein (TIGR02543 family)
MWGNSPWGDLSALQLDVGHDDYYLAHIPGCPDLSGSRFLEGGGAALTVATNAAGAQSGQVLTDDQPLAQSEFECAVGVCIRYFDAWPAQEVKLEAIDTATAERFIGWSGACTGTSPTCSVMMDASKSVTAHFGLRPAPRLAVATVGRGRVVSRPVGISCPRRCVARFPFESSVDLIAKPVRGWRFSRWRDSRSMCARQARCLMIVDYSNRFKAVFVRRKSRS